ncbi:CPBP family intramembrane metalloprotease [Streptomyces sp. MUM 203J]|nr:CPBP family intramembrane metalloprotease [Streptomyces sp. MUM 203J]
MARVTDRHSWWRPPLGTLLVFGGWIPAMLVLVVGAEIAGLLAGLPQLPDDEGTDFGPVVSTALDLLVIAIALPLVLLAVRWVGARPAGTVSSVTGRLRVGWLGRCLMAAAAVQALSTTVMLLLPAGETAEDAPADVWVGWGPYAASLTMLILLVPLQAAAEEYVCRGWLFQAVGQFLRSPWLATLPQALVFAALHGWGTVWGFVDLLVFGVVVGMLSVRTGGLEAAISLHVVNNLVAFGFTAAFVDGLLSEETAADMPWEMAVVDIVSILLYAALILWLTPRGPRPPERLSPLPVTPAALPTPPYPYAHAAPPAYGPYGAVPPPHGPYGAVPPPHGPYGAVPPPHSAVPPTPGGTLPAGQEGQEDARLTR